MAKSLFKKLVLASLILGCNIAAPITNTGVAIGSLATGVAAGGIALHKYGSKFKVNKTIDSAIGCFVRAIGGAATATGNLATDAINHPKAPGVIVAAVVAGGGFGAYKFLSRFTPEGRLKRALKLIEKIDESPFMMNLYKNIHQGRSLESIINRYNINSDWPLVILRLALLDYRSKALEAISLLGAAMKDKEDDQLFIRDCLAAKTYSKDLLNVLNDVVEVIAQSDEYKSQYAFYQKDLIAKQQLQQERDLHRRDHIQDGFLYLDKRIQKERHHKKNYKQKERLGR